MKKSLFSHCTCIVAFLIVMWLDAPGVATAATITVTSLADSGPGTLRQALLDNNAAGGGDTITFGSLSGTIVLTSGELDITKSVHISGPGAPTLTVSGNNNSQVFVSAGSNAPVVISALTITGGNAQINRGGYTYAGAGVCQEPGSGPMFLTGCVITGNLGSIGGGIYSADQMILIDCTVANNTAQLQGGGIMALGTMQIYNSTVANNIVGTTCSFGGGLACDGTVGITGCTISGNTQQSTCGSGGGIYASGGTVSITNSIVAGNTSGSSQGPDCSGTFQSGGYNLIGKNSNETGFVNGVNHDQVGTSGSPINPLLGALGYYGGVTEVMPLLNGSPAIDQGISAGLTTDQRGGPRPTDLPWIANAGDGSDIGAFEYDARGPLTLVINFPITGVTHQFTPPGGPFGGHVVDLLTFTESNLNNLDLSQYGTLAVRFFATNGQEVIVNPPATNCAMATEIFYSAAGFDALSNSATGTLSFENFSGNMPVRNYNFFSTGGNGNTMAFEPQENLTGSIGFTAMEYAFQPIDVPTNSPKTFTPGGGDMVIFSYSTGATNDPGPIVTLGPALNPRIVPGTGKVNLQWASRSNLTLEVQTSSNLVTWQDNSNYAGNGQTNTFSDGTSKGMIFYRLKVVPPN